MSKYGHWPHNKFEALVNKLGGEEKAEMFLRGELAVVSSRAAKASVIKIDRTTPFDPVKFFGPGWSIWRGPAKGKGLEGEEDQDNRSLALTEIDLGMLSAKQGFKDGEIINGEEKLAKLLQLGILADAKIFELLLKQPGQTILYWLKGVSGVRNFDFPGTIFRTPTGKRVAASVFLTNDHGDISWRWDTHDIVFTDLRSVVIKES